jgi:regulator of protease activity HflC (stomatin/prohibitin superfamily)
MEQRISAEDISAMFVALTGCLEKIKKITSADILNAMNDKRDKKNNSNKKYYDTNKDSINEARKARYAEKKAKAKAEKEAAAAAAEAEAKATEATKKSKGKAKKSDNDTDKAEDNEIVPVPKIGKKKPKNQKEFIEAVKQL